MDLHEHRYMYKLSFLSEISGCQILINQDMEMLSIQLLIPMWHTTSEVITDAAASQMRKANETDTFIGSTLKTTLLSKMSSDLQSLTHK